jgi:hypothetical protein
MTNESQALHEPRTAHKASAIMAAGFLTILTLAGGCSDDDPTEVTAPNHGLTVVVSGSGLGTVTSQPAGISCRADGGTCTSPFPEGTQVTRPARLTKGRPSRGGVVPAPEPTALSPWMGPRQ